MLRTFCSEPFGQNLLDCCLLPRPCWIRTSMKCLLGTPASIAVLFGHVTQSLGQSRFSLQPTRSDGSDSWRAGPTETHTTWQSLARFAGRASWLNWTRVPGPADSFIPSTESSGCSEHQNMCSSYRICSERDPVVKQNRVHDHVQITSSTGPDHPAEGSDQNFWSEAAELLIVRSEHV